jgi:hypothetical protein
MHKTVRVFELNEQLRCVFSDELVHDAPSLGAYAISWCVTEDLGQVCLS